MKIINLNNKTLTSELLVLFLISTSLLNINIFYYSTLFSYHSFVIISSLCAIVAVYKLISSKIDVYFVKSGVIIFCSWLVYILLQALTLYQLTQFHLYILSALILFFSLIILFSNENFNFKRFHIGIIIIATIESLYCISQYLNIFKSHNEFFKVTGSYVNPNVTAMFLALTIPFFLNEIKSNEQKINKIILFCLTSLIIALFLLKCRTAILGLGLAILMYITFKYLLIEKLKTERNNITKLFFFVLTLIFIATICLKLFSFKKESTNGRQLIWKLSSLMIKEKPLQGHGYGLFEKNYNQFQSSYFKNHFNDYGDLKNAGPVNMAYNEYLQSFVDGGIVGLFLLIMVFVSLFIMMLKYKKNNVIIKNKNTLNYINTSFSGIMIFALMSSINFTIQAIPVMAMFIIYCSYLMIFTVTSSKESHLIDLKNNVFQKVCYILTGTVVIFILINSIILINAELNTKKAYILNQKGNKMEALKLIGQINKNLILNDSYWKNYGEILLSQKRYNEAIIKFNEAKKISSMPDLYLQTGFCYTRTNQFHKACIEYEKAVFLDPSKFLNRYLLIQAYIKTKDTTNIIVYSKSILDLPPKIKSKQVTMYKQFAYNILKNLKVEEITRKPINLNYNMNIPSQKN